MTHTEEGDKPQHLQTYERNSTNRYSNNRITISIPVALISLIIMILGMILPSVYSYGQLNSRVDSLEMTIEKNLIRHVDAIEQIEEQLINCERHSAATEVTLLYIKESLKEIKQNTQSLKVDIISTGGEYDS